MNMIDLAGSENSKTSGVEGQQLEECKSINSSLSALSGVFKALREHQKFVPYRNSKLTQALEEQLTSDSKTLMIVNVSAD